MPTTELSQDDLFDYACGWATSDVQSAIDASIDSDAELRAKLGFIAALLGDAAVDPKEKKSVLDAGLKQRSESEQETRPIEPQSTFVGAPDELVVAANRTDTSPPPAVSPRVEVQLPSSWKWLPLAVVLLAVAILLSMVILAIAVSGQPDDSTQSDVQQRTPSRGTSRSTWTSPTSRPASRPSSEWSSRREEPTSSSAKACRSAAPRARST